MCKLIKNSRSGQDGFSIVESLVVASAVAFTGLAAYSVFYSTADADSDDVSRLAFSTAITRVERALPNSCLATLFDQPDDPDRRVPDLGASRPRQAILGIRVGTSVTVGRARIEYTGINLTHVKDLGRDVSYLSFDVLGQVNRKYKTLALKETIPILVRSVQTANGREVLSCAAIGDDQPAEFLAYIGQYMGLARITNPTNFHELVLCIGILGTPSCNNPQVWGSPLQISSTQQDATENPIVVGPGTGSIGTVPPLMLITSFDRANPSDWRSSIDAAAGSHVDSIPSHDATDATQTGAVYGF